MASHVPKMRSRYPTSVFFRRGEEEGAPCSGRGGEAGQDAPTGKKKKRGSIKGEISRF